VESSDELGSITRSFNAMREQLAEARAVADANQMQLSAAHTYLQSILANMSAGVLAFDEDLQLRSYNRSAGHILDIDVAALERSELGRWSELAPSLAPFSAELAASFRNAGDAEWQKQLERGGTNGTQMLLLRGARLPTSGGTGYVVVFDDITHVLQAQRDAAWTEVARRLAHEIKNPLTPIQLSAERLQSKLAGKLATAEAEMLARSTQTIVNQVGALKNMVDAFREYAHMPEPVLEPVDLNALLREVLTLYESLAGWVHVELAPALPPLIGDRAQLRQVIHNLLQNAQDALAGVQEPSIVVRSEAAGGVIRVTITDNGSGFPETMMRRAFEPYMTTKPKGTGLGLVIVKKIIEEHGGTITISNITPHGARVVLTLPATATANQAVKSAIRA
jgi:nitrogen fixation/metabolism regulation signal transduction histidine kinase